VATKNACTEAAFAIIDAWPEFARLERKYSRDNLHLLVTAIKHQNLELVDFLLETGPGSGIRCRLCRPYAGYKLRRCVLGLPGLPKGVDEKGNELPNARIIFRGSNGEEGGWSTQLSLHKRNLTLI